MQWFIDFDDTLALGPTTWAIQTVLPRLIRAHGLPYSDDLLHAALLRGQEIAAQGQDESQALETVFTMMNWPPELKRTLVEEVFERYVPVLFDDARPFLQRLRAGGEPLAIVSNNNHAPQIAEALGIAVYVNNIFTPDSCGIKRGKPHRDVWDYICDKHEIQNAVMVGDDPWSDGAFADACGIPCVLVDRLDRFAHFTQYYRVGSLNEIEPTGTA
jgi:HAD superfamily hydrolase (TIGR01549 family)